jgi:hypothetical protein
MFLPGNGIAAILPRTGGLGQMPGFDGSTARAWHWVAAAGSAIRALPPLLALAAHPGGEAA